MNIFYVWRHTSSQASIFFKGFWPVTDETATFPTICPDSSIFGQFVDPITAVAGDAACDHRALLRLIHQYYHQFSFVNFQLF